MYTVTCPSCNKVLKIPQAVSNARIRCTGCQAVFVGSSTPFELGETTPARRLPVAATARPKSGGSGKARLYRGKPKAPVSPVIIAVVAAGVLGVVVLAAVFAYKASKDADDKRSDKDVSKKQPDQPATPATPAGVGRNGAGVRRPDTGPRRGGAPDTQPALPPTNGGRTAGTGGTPPEHDALIKVDYKRQTDDYSNVILYGEVRNAHKYPVRQAIVEFIVRDPAGKEIKARAVCNHIPVKSAVGFSVNLGAMPEDVSVTVVAKSVPEPKDIVCWRVDTDNVRLDGESVKGSIIINGQVTNATDTTVANVEIHCDFFSRAGHHHSTVIGKLTKAFRIAPGKTEAYRVTLENVLTPAAIRNQTVVRLVGRAVQ